MPHRPRKTVQIVGAAPSLLDCPVIDGAERWIFNASYLADGGRPYTRVFNLHEKAVILAIQPAAWAWYARQDRPVYLITSDAEIPRSERFPFEELQECFSHETLSGEREDEQCFGGTVDFLIAYALMEGFAHIDLVGVECRSAEEYQEQRSSILYWMGMARGMGATVTTTRSSGLGRMPAIYGYNLQTGAPIPPGDYAGRWRRGHPNSVWPPPVEGWRDPVLYAKDDTLLQGAFEHL